MAHIIGTLNDDILTGTPDDDLIEGLDGNDTLTGGGGNDTLDGGTGIDSMAGGPGDDIYYVDNIGFCLRGPFCSPGDTVVENASEGTDEVRLTVPLFARAYYLPENVENLTLVGAANGGGGNELANVITGNDGDNWLFGLGGPDTLVGGGGIDTASYDLRYRSPSGVTVSLLTNTGSGGDAEGDTFSGIENLVGSELADTLVGDSGANRLSGADGDDTLVGGMGNDSFDGGPGNDVLDGGGGIDNASYGGRSYYGVLTYNGQLVVGSVWDGLDRLASIETLTFAYPPYPPDVPQVVSSAYANSPLEYIASYPDLVAAFGTNAGAGFNHFVETGYAEGRTVTFDGLEYIASYTDLMDALGANAGAGAGHYIEAGQSEGRTTTFDGLEYVASYGDLIQAFGANADAGASHYIGAGRSEGRQVTFDGLEYIASYGDLIEAFQWQVLTSNDPDYVGDIGANHYIVAGYAEQRAPDLFDAAQYLANYTDLQAAFGTDTKAATLHYISSGYYEGRTDYPGGVPPGQVIVGTEGNDYLKGGRGPDQISGLGGDDHIEGSWGDDTIDGGLGNDVLHGMGGNNTLIGGGGNDLLSGSDGTDSASYAGSRSQYGVLASYYGEVVVGSVGEGLDTLYGIETLKFSDQSLPTTRADSPLEYIASYTDLMAAFGTDGVSGLNHFTSSGYAEGRTVTFDGLEYIASYPDLIDAFHNEVARNPDPDMGANHYIIAGYAESRAPDLFDAAQYLAKYADLQAAFGNNTEAATIHYITNGYFEGRTDNPLL